MGDRSIAGMPVKCIVVGDPEVGKTCLMLAFVRQDGSFEYNPSSVDSYTVGMTIGSHKINLFLQDTAGLCHSAPEQINPSKFSKFSKTNTNPLWRRRLRVVRCDPHALLRGLAGGGARLLAHLRGHARQHCNKGLCNWHLLCTRFNTRAHNAGEQANSGRQRCTATPATALCCLWARSATWQAHTARSRPRRATSRGRSARRNTSRCAPQRATRPQTSSPPQHASAVRSHRRRCVCGHA